MDYFRWTIIWFLLSLFFAVLEIFVPSGGLLAFLSVSTLIISAVFAFYYHPLFGSGYLVALMIFVPFFLWWAVRFFPKTFMGRRIILNPDGVQPNPKLESIKTFIGKAGVAKSKMMLSGLVEINGQKLNAVSESETIEVGEEIIAVRADGVNLLVRKFRPPNVSSQKMVVLETAEIPEDLEDPFA
jgi:membrane-bound serine protease (ClpP class)